MGSIPRGWLLLGLAASIPQVVSADTQTAQLAISIGGLLLGYQAFGRLTGSLSQASGAVIAWQQVADMVRASRTDIESPPLTICDTFSHPTRLDEHQKIIEGTELVYRYREHSEPVLRHCSFKIYRGERILLEGPSGEGKSTLISLLTALRTPESGLLLVQGLDFHTLGPDGWRRRVAAAPQFHENHVLTGTLAFNLLLGRNWPAEPEELDEARKVCEELGLGRLLERMPSGVSQVVGETGWQLSHGERSRLFIARALLQGGDLVVFDESFAALDPENLRLALDCVLKRSRTLLVVAHP
jgi:ATP-binding cassette subfamily B protein